MTTALPDLPGGVGIAALRVHPWEAADGLCGGSPHMHLCCTEGYIVVNAATLGMCGHLSPYDPVRLAGAGTDPGTAR